MLWCFIYVVPSLSFHNTFLPLSVPRHLPGAAVVEAVAAAAAVAGIVFVVVLVSAVKIGTEAVVAVAGIDFGPAVGISG